MQETIMIVDDAKFARSLVKRALQNGGFTEFVEAKSAAEAKALYAQTHPALVLLDITLPDNSDLTLLHDLLTADPDAKIIMISAIGQKLIIADAIEMGAKNFVIKPFEEQELLDVIKSVLGLAAAK